MLNDATDGAQDNSDGRSGLRARAMAGFDQDLALIIDEMWQLNATPEGRASLARVWGVIKPNGKPADLSIDEMKFLLATAYVGFCTINFKLRERLERGEA
ncbi:MAG TPA: hypothetical protein VM008_01910 [Phycisphaerae bacterium]|nr:hypothetical protein [Phycisphaerae bacterium]